MVLKLIFNMYANGRKLWRNVIITQNFILGTLKLVDVRDPQELETQGKIPKSINIPRKFNIVKYVFT